MALFNNKDVDDTGMPPEVHQYYQAEQRERVGVAWLLAFGTLVITVGIALGGFYGGRAVYRKVAKKDKTSTTSQVASESKSNTKPQASTNSSSPTSTSSNKPGQVSSQAATTKTPPPVTTPTTTASTNPQLPHTGPEGDD